MVKQWLSLRPIDTLFFRGSEPMIAGESHEVRSVFPPMPSTLVGSICTAIMAQHNIKPADFVAHAGPKQEILENYPLLGEPGKPNFAVLGPFLTHSVNQKDIDWLFPCPADWFGKLPAPRTDCDSKREQKEAVLIEISLPELAGDKIKSLGLLGSVTNPPLIIAPKILDVKTLAGNWVNQAAMKAIGERITEVYYCDDIAQFDSKKPMIISPKALFSVEPRVGLALENGLRKAKTGHLYGSTHVRLKNSVNMAVGLSENLVDSHLDRSGILSLGGEQRIVSYQLLATGPAIPSLNSDKIMALTPFPLQSLKDYELENCPRVSGPVLTMGGWDMKARFHKPCRAYLPAGAVIWRQNNENTPFGFIRL